MIDSFKTDQACTAKLKAFCDTHGFTLIPFGSGQVLDTDKSYVKERLLDNNETTIGLSGGSSDIERPIYQISVLTPKAQSQFINKQMTHTVKGCFRKAEIILQDSEQTVQVQDTDKSGVMFTETHAESVLSVNLTVIASN